MPYLRKIPGILPSSALVLSVVLTGSRARAQDGKVLTSSERQAAQALFDEGRTLMQVARFSEACPRFAQSQRIDPGGGTLLNLALCHEKEGKISSAWGEFHEALAGARHDRRRDREQLAQERIDVLTPKLPRLSVEVPSPPVGLEIKIDHAPLAKDAWGVPTPLDPGVHTLQAQAPGKALWLRQITLREGETQHASIFLEQSGAAAVPDPCAMPVESVPCITPAPPATKTNAPGAPSGGTPPPSALQTETAPEGPEGHRRAAFYVAGGLGIAAIGASIATGVFALDAQSDGQSKCPLANSRQFCKDASGVDAANNARTFAWVSTITLAGGVAALGVALLWPKRYDEPKASPAPAPTPAPKRVSASIVPVIGGAMGTFRTDLF